MLFQLTIKIENLYLEKPLHFKARGGGGGVVKVDFRVFTYLIRPAEDEQEEKTDRNLTLRF